MKDNGHFRKTKLPLVGAGPEGPSCNFFGGGGRGFFGLATGGPLVGATVAVAVGGEEAAFGGMAGSGLDVDGLGSRTSGTGCCFGDWFPSGGIAWICS